MSIVKFAIGLALCVSVASSPVNAQQELAPQENEDDFTDPNADGRDNVVSCDPDATEGTPEFCVSYSGSAAVVQEYVENGDTIVADRITGGINLGSTYTISTARLDFGIGSSTHRSFSTGTGFRRDGPPGSSPEDFAVITEDTLEMLKIEAGVEVGNVRLEGSFSEGEASSIFVIDGGEGIDSGIVYGALSPGGSSGIATGFGSRGEIREQVDEFSATFLYKVYGDPDSGSATPNEQFQAWLFGRFTHRERAIDSTVWSEFEMSDFPFEFMQIREQNLSEDHFEAGLRVSTTTRLGSSLLFSAEGAASVYLDQAELASIERNSNNFTGPPDGDFTQQIRTSDSNFGAHLELGAGLVFPITDRFALTLGGAVHYYSTAARIFNPNSGDQVFFDDLSTDLLFDDDSFSYEGGVQFTIFFGVN